MAANFKNVRTISLTAVLIALTIIGNRYFIIPIIPKILEIRFGFLFLAVIAYFFGPVAAFAAGVATSMLGFLMFPTGAVFNPLFDLNEGLKGLFYAVFLYKRNHKSEYFIVWIVASRTLVKFICHIIINTRLLILVGIIPASGAGIITITRVFSNVVLIPVDIIMMLFILKFVANYAYKFNFIKLPKLRKDVKE